MMITFLLMVLFPQTLFAVRLTKYLPGPLGVRKLKLGSGAVLLEIV